MRRFIRIIDKAPAAVRKYQEDPEEALESIRRNFSLRESESSLSVWLDGEIDAIAVFAATKRDRIRQMQMIEFDESLIGATGTLKPEHDCEPECISTLHYGLTLNDLDEFAGEHPVRAGQQHSYFSNACCG